MSLSHNSMSDLSKVKLIPDHKIDVAQMIEFVFGRIYNIMR